jgi:hypothetical protein
MGSNSGLAGSSSTIGPLAGQALDGDFVLHPGDDDLAVADFGGAMDGQQVAIKNAGVAHTHPAHLEQIVSAGGEQAGVNLVAALDVLGGKDGAAGGNPPDQGQAEGFHEADAPGTALFKGDGTLGGQGAEVGFRRVGGAETKGGADLGPGGGTAFLLRRCRG